MTKTAAVYGTGTIGACIATLLIGNGVKTVVVGHSKAGMERCAKIVVQNLTALQEAEKISASQAEKMLSLLMITDDYMKLETASFIFEAVAESLEVKQSVYRQIESICGKTALIASTTSALPPEILSKSLMRPERFMVAHPFQPAHMLPLFELVGNSCTSQDALDSMRRFLENDLNRVVVCLQKQIEGFIVNRIAQAMFRECLYLLEQGVASAADIDKAIHYAVGMRYASIGLLEYFDAVGFSLERDIAKTIYPTLCNETSIQHIVEAGIAEGKTGISAGEGLYTWTEEQIADFNQRKAAPYLHTFKWNLPE